MVDGTMMGGIDKYETKRTLVAPALTASSTHNGTSFAFDGGVSRGYSVDSVLLTPRAALSYASVEEDRYTETGAGAVSLSLAPHGTDSLRSHLGVTVSRADAMDAMFAPELHLGWRHEFMDDVGRVSASYIGSGGPGFVQVSAPLGRDAAEFGVGATIALPSEGLGVKASAFAGYNGAVSARGSDHSFEAGFRLAW
jgi:outer membrane autotransporter protein